MACASSSRAWSNCRCPACKARWSRCSSSSATTCSGLTALTRQTVGASATALTDAAVLYIPVEIVDTLVKTRPGLARDIGAAIDYRQGLGDKALAEVGESRLTEALVIA